MKKGLAPSLELNKKQWRMLVSILVVEVVAVDVANFKPGPSEETKSVAVEVKAVYELDIQLAAVARMAIANSDNSGVRSYSAELQDYSQVQKQKLHDWFTKNNMKLEDVTVPANLDLTLTHGYLQQMSKKTMAEFDASLRHYPTDLEAHLAIIDSKTYFVRKAVVKEFTEVKCEVTGAKALIG